MKEKPPCPFGKVLVAARQTRGVSQYRLAQLVDRNPRYISQLEHGKREPLISTVIMLARALQMDSGELVRELENIMPVWADEEPEEPSNSQSAVPSGVSPGQSIPKKRKPL